MQRYSAYKDSGFDWLGEIPAHWEVEKLKNVSTIKLSGVDKKSYDDGISVRLCNYVDVYKNEYIDAGLNFMSATATESEINNLELKAGDVIITKDSETWDDIAVPAFVPKNLDGVICAYHLALIRANSEKALGEYLFRAIMSIPVSRYFHISSNGVTRYGLTQLAIKQARIPIPPKDEQEAIATFLREQTAVINQFLANKRELITLLEEQKQVVINTAVTQGLDPNSPRKPSGIDWLGDIPAHWEIKKLWYMIDLVGGSTPSKEKVEYWTNGTIPWVSPKDMKSLEITSSIDQITEKALQETSIQLINPPVILIVVRGLILARTIPIALTRIPLTINQDMKAMTVKSKDSPKFLSFLLRGMQQLFMAFIEDSGHGTKRFRTNDLKQISLAIPPLEEQEAILDFIEQKTAVINTAIKRIQREIELIEEYRTTLIAHAVTGKIDVRPQPEMA